MLISAFDLTEFCCDIFLDQQLSAIERTDSLQKYLYNTSIEVNNKRTTYLFVVIVLVLF